MSGRARMISNRKQRPTVAIERDDERLEHADAVVLQREQQQHVEAGDQHADRDGNAEQQVERDRRPDHFREIAGRDRDLAEHPEDDRRRAAE